MGRVPLLIVSGGCGQWVWLTLRVGCVLNAWNVGGSELRESLKEGAAVRITKATANSRYDVHYTLYM